jgi:hypothetical protein
LGHSRPSHFVPVLNNVRYASDSDHSRYESELTLWAKSDRLHRRKTEPLDVSDKPTLWRFVAGNRRLSNTS